VARELERLGGTENAEYPEKQLAACPGCSWDRVHFHNKLLGLTQTADQMGYSGPCDVMRSI